jgi:predicted nucleic acid-binding protein
VVIADTSIWIEFFNRPKSKEKRRMDFLIDENQLLFVGPVLMELLQGCRTSRDADIILNHVSALPFLEMSFSTWRRTGEISAGLRRKGITLPTIDLIIAVLAMEHDAEVFTVDPHFQKIPGLKLYKP